MKAFVIASTLVISAFSLVPVYASSLSAPLPSGSSSEKAVPQASQDGSIVINSLRLLKRQP